MYVTFMTTVCWFAIPFAEIGACCSLCTMLLFSVVRQLPTKTKKVASMEKKLELEKRLESVQNVLGTTSQTTKKPKLGKSLQSISCT